MSSEGRPTSRWVESKPSSGWFAGLDARELWGHRELALLFAWREIKLRYKQTVAGLAWVLLQPLLAMALFTILLERGVSIPSEGVAYPVFAYVGLAVWIALTTAVGRAAEAFVQDPDLLTNVYFPRLLAPLGIVLPVVVDAAVALSLAVPLMVAYDVALPPATLVALPLCFVWLVAVAASIGIWTSALNVLYRDVRYTMAFGLQIWLFASPVLYPSSLVDGDLHLLYFINPAAGFLDVTRACILGTPIDVAGAAVSLAALAIIAVTGVAYFQRVERTLADRI